MCCVFVCVCLPMVVCVQLGEFTQSFLCTLSSESSFSVLIPAVLHGLLQRTQHLETDTLQTRTGSLWTHKTGLLCTDRSGPLWTCRTGLLWCSLSSKVYLESIINEVSDYGSSKCRLSPSCCSSPRLQGSEVLLSLWPPGSASPQSWDGSPALPERPVRTQVAPHLDMHIHYTRMRT